MGMALCVPNLLQPSARETGLWTEVRLCCRSNLRVELHDLVCKGWEKGSYRKREVQEPGMNTLPCLHCAISSEGLGYSPTHVIKGSKAPCCILKGQWWSQFIYRFYTRGQFQVNASIKTWVKSIPLSPLDLAHDSLGGPLCLRLQMHFGNPLNLWHVNSLIWVINYF